MKKRFEKILFDWPQPFIRDIDLMVLLKVKDQARYDLVNRALKNNSLIILKRGLYLISSLFRRENPNAFVLAQQIYGPSYISLESALSFHGWIPEAVLQTTSVCSKRSKTFTNEVGEFSYQHIPSEDFYVGVISFEEALMASPWKAVADCIYAYEKQWKSPLDLTLDMRIEAEDMLASDLNVLKDLSINYPSKRVRNILEKLFLGLKNECGFN
jgi:hypothetical protein